MTIKHLTPQQTKKVMELLDDLGWEYQRMGMSGRETYDEICHLLNMIPEDEVYMEI